MRSVTHFYSVDVEYRKDPAGRKSEDHVSGMHFRRSEKLPLKVLWEIWRAVTKQLLTCIGRARVSKSSPAYQLVEAVCTQVADMDVADYPRDR